MGATRPGWPASTAGSASPSAASRSATLVVEGTYVALIPDVSGPADATVICADEDVMRKLLAGRAEPVHRVDAAHGPLAGDRGFGTRVMLGLQVESPFARPAQEEET